MYTATAAEHGKEVSAIYEKLAAGSMPCDGPWAAEDVERFRAWIDNGSSP